eukprot:c3052_g1_i1.p1 GENE.c3052_g1_i1~~c3052_g1_i1.p1  ORF type:complete len:587 (-),score=274.71 c3052_g1_i1:62-1822(-)
MDKDKNPGTLTSFIEKIRCEDKQVRISCVKQIDKFAFALGERSARTDLLPLLNELLKDEDDVQMLLAESLGKLGPCVGGPSFAALLIPPLEALAQSENTTIRKQAVESLRVIVELMPYEDQCDKFVGMIKRLLTGSWFPSKISGINLLHFGLKYAAKNEREAFLGDIVAFSQDRLPVIRKSLAVSISSIAAVLEAQETITVLLPVLTELINDTEEVVRVLAIRSSSDIAHALGTSDAAKYILPIFSDSVASASWRVRYVCAETFVSMCKAFDAEIVTSEMIPLFNKLVLQETEKKPEIRQVLARQSVEFIGLLSDDETQNNLVRTLKSLSSDESPNVRWALSSVITDFAPLFGPLRTQTFLIPLYIELLSDEECQEVRLHIISRLEDIHQVITIESFMQLIFPKIIELTGAGQWRVRLAAMEYIPVLAEHLGVEFVDSDLLDICLSWLGDNVYTIRQRAGGILKSLALIFGIDWATKQILPRLSALAKHKIYIFRAAALSAVVELSQVFGSNLTASTLLPIILQMKSDEVSNIRYLVCKSLLSLIPILPNETSLEQARDVLTRLHDDRASEVKKIAGDALNLFASH